MPDAKRVLSVPWWCLLSALSAPLLLVGGFTLSAARQPLGFDSSVHTISALAAANARASWLMTCALYGLGLCHLVTSVGLRAAAKRGRVVLGCGGLATVLVAASPTASGGVPLSHSVPAGLAFGALSLWPAFARRSDPATPLALRAPIALPVTALLCASLAWFTLELAGAGARIGLSERVTATAQALWPLVVVLSARWTGAR